MSVYELVGRFVTSDSGKFKGQKLKIFEYPSDITIYPGHGKESKLGLEQDNLSLF